MPPSHDILLLHEAGPDRQALGSYLERQGMRVTVCDEARQAVQSLAREGVRTRFILLAHQKRIEAASREALDMIASCPAVLIVPAGSAPLPDYDHVVREPFYLDQVVRALDAAAAPTDASSDAASERAPEAGHDLLRGLAHAINNPLTAALGWLRLLETELPERDEKRRLVNQARGELERLARVSQALALLASPLEDVPLDLGALVAAAVARATHEGGGVTFERDASRVFQVAGSAVAYDLMLALLLASATDAKGLDSVEVALDDREGFVTLRLRDPGAVVPDADALRSIGRLLRVERHQRALGLTLAQALARRAGGTFRCEAASPQGATVVLSVPSAARAPGARRRAP